LADLPLYQGIAVTGSVNQNGEIQAVGGVNQKIEGFYAVCKHKGLDGRQGVIIPRQNISQLMLSDETIAAVEAGTFHIWAVETIDEGLEIVTGIPAGTREDSGKFTKGSVHERVDRKLSAWSARRVHYGGEIDRDNTFRKVRSPRRRKEL
jgi:predicted ATP-dependent protease